MFKKKSFMQICSRFFSHSHFVCLFLSVPQSYKLGYTPQRRSIVSYCVNRTRPSLSLCCVSHVRHKVHSLDLSSPLLTNLIMFSHMRHHSLDLSSHLKLSCSSDGHSPTLTGWGFSSDQGDYSSNVSFFLSFFLIVFLFVCWSCCRWVFFGKIQVD